MYDMQALGEPIPIPPKNEQENEIPTPQAQAELLKKSFSIQKVKKKKRKPVVDLTGLAGVALKMEMDLVNQASSFEDVLMYNPFDTESRFKVDEELRI